MIVKEWGQTSPQRRIVICCPFKSWPIRQTTRIEGATALCEDPAHTFLWSFSKVSYNHCYFLSLFLITTDWGTRSTLIFREKLAKGSKLMGLSVIPKYPFTLSLIRHQNGALVNLDNREASPRPVLVGLLESITILLATSPLPGCATGVDILSH